jgi:ceramide glucosyltransferase
MLPSVVRSEVGRHGISPSPDGDSEGNGRFHRAPAALYFPHAVYIIQFVHAVLTGAVAATCLVFLGCTVFGEARLRRRWKAPAARFEPPAVLIVPCKGVQPDTATNLRRVLSLDWPRLRVRFVVESRDDPAYALLRRVAAGRADARVVVAGIARTCTQKVHNLLRGIRSTEEADDVLVFMDSDLRVDRGWLRRLLAPLADPRVAAVTGTAWTAPDRSSIAAWVDAFWYAMVRFLLSVPWFNGVAGCSTAIRRRVFEEMHVAETWSTALSDDMSLTRILARERRRALFVPSCLGRCGPNRADLRGVLDRIRRQSQMVECVSLPLWLLDVVGFGVVVADLLAVPGLVAAAAFVPALRPLAVQAAAFALLFCIGASLLQAGVPGERVTAWLLRAPLLIVLTWAGLVSAAGATTVRWAGVTYRAGLDGRIRHVVRGS